MDAGRACESVSDSDEGESDLGCVSDSDGGESDSHESVSDFEDDDWVKVGACEVLDNTSIWRGVDILAKKGDHDRVCLWFGGDEYEGIPGTYRYDKVNEKLYDDDGDLIPSR